MARSAPEHEGRERRDEAHATKVANSPKNRLSGGVGYALVRVFVIGAGQVGVTIVEALHEEHEITVLDSEGIAPPHADSAASTSRSSRATARAGRTCRRQASATPTSSSPARRATR